MPSLRIRNLIQAYDRIRILNGIDATFNRGEVALITGRNGAGKTTLLKVIGGLLKPLQGGIEVAGEAGSLNLYLPNTGLYDDLTLMENLLLFQNLFRASDHDLERFVAGLSLRDILSQRVRNLSHGQRVKGGLCRTFLKPAGVYLLDEAFSGLDQQSCHALTGLMQSLCAAGKTLLVTMHEADVLRGMEGRRFWMESGKLTEVAAHA